VPIFTKLVFGERLFIRKFCTEVHENPADGLVADSTYVADGSTYSPHNSLFFYYVYKLKKEGDAGKETVVMKMANNKNKELCS